MSGNFISQDAKLMFPRPRGGEIGSTVLNTRTGIDETRLKCVLVALLALVIVLLQFIFREFDDNKLLSWQWVMNQQLVLWLLIIAAMGLFLVYQSSVKSFHPKNEIQLVVGASIIISITTWSVPEFMVDSARYFSHAKIISTQGLSYFLAEWGGNINAWTDMPLVSIIYGIIFSVFGESRLPIQVLNTAFYTATIFSVYLIGSRLWNARVGIFAAWIMLAMPFLSMQVSQILIDVPAMFFTTLALYATLVAISKPATMKILFASAAICTAALTKYSTWLVLCALVLLPLALPSGQRIQAIKPLTIVGLISGGVMAFVYIVYHPLVIDQLRILGEYQIPALSRWQESYISTFLFQVHPFVTLAALASFFVAVKTKQAVWLIPAAALFVMLAMGVYRARYLLIALPMLALIAAFGFSYVKNEMLQRFVVRAAVVMSVAVSLPANLNFMNHYSAVNLAQTGKYLNALSESEVAVLVLPQPETEVNPWISMALLDYYTDKNMVRIGSPLPYQGIDSEQLSISPLRFTWEVAQYPYAQVEALGSSPTTAIAIIAKHNDRELSNEYAEFLKNLLLNNYVQHASFAVADEVFRFQTVVAVYRHMNHLVTAN